MSERPRVGFIGLGSQGAPMAGRILSEGFPLVVWARRPANLEELIGLGAEPASSPARLARDVDVVCVCVRSDDDVEEVCGGDHGILAGLKGGAILAIHSTVDPATVRGLVERVGALDAALLDAPVSGGALAAAAGRLVTMVGGDELVLERCREVFGAHSDRVFHVGGIGTAQMAKLLNNGLFAAGVALAESALATGERLGLDRGRLGEILSSGSGRSFALEMAAGTRNVHAAIGALMTKDVGLLRALVGDAEANRLVVAAQWVLDAPH